MPRAVNGMKECTKCGETKDVSEYYKRHHAKDGLRSNCKKCRKQYGEDNREAIAERKRQHYQNNKGVLREKSRLWYQAAKDSGQIEQYLQDNKEAIRKRQNRYRQNNREKTRETERRYYQKSPAGVYEIENKITGKIYVGQSMHWKKRWTQHKNKLSLGKHNNSFLQADYDEHGLDAFEHRVVEYPCDTPPDVLKEHERRTLINCIREGKEIYNGIC